MKTLGYAVTGPRGYLRLEATRPSLEEEEEDEAAMMRGVPGPCGVVELVDRRDADLRFREGYSEGQMSAEPQRARDVAAARESSRLEFRDALEAFDPFLDEAEIALRKLVDGDDWEPEVLQRFYDARARLAATIRNGAVR